MNVLPGRHRRSNAQPSSLARQTTIATACRNREANLAAALQTWLKAAPAQVIICDWGSDEPLSHARLGIPPERQRHVAIHRVEADRWVLTWAFNEALSRVRSPFTLKLDCDHTISEDFFHKNTITVNSFSRGHWRTQRSSQQYINGAFFSCTELLQHVGYYDERITTYGWDDSDLYERLYESSSMATTLARGTIQHLDQDDQQRTSAQDVSREASLANFLAIKKTKFLIERNRILTRMLWPWNEQLFRERHRIRERFAGINPQEEGLIEFATIRAFEQFYTQLGKDQYQSTIDAYHAVISQNQDIKTYRTSAYLSATILEQYAKACQANNDLKKNILRLGLLSGATNEAQHEQRLQALTRSQTGRPKHPTTTTTSQGSSPAATPKQQRAPSPLYSFSKLYVDAQHGLGNRLRAIASAAAIAKASEKELVIVWQPDHHCQARFSDLFNYDGAVEELSFIDTAASFCDRIYNYMTTEQGARKDEDIDLALKGNLYIRSAFTLKSRVSNWDAENAFLRSLRVHDFILGLTSAIRQPNDLSVHVRMAGGQNYEHLAYEHQSNWTQEDHEKIAEWRKKSHYSNFFKRIDQLIKENRVDSIFVAADLPGTYDQFRLRYGDRLTWLPRQKNDRSTEQLQFALADAVLLSRAKIFLGSTWSSFSELAMRLADSGIHQEMSGIDF